MADLSYFINFTKYVYERMCYIPRMRRNPWTTPSKTMPAKRMKTSADAPVFTMSSRPQEEGRSGHIKLLYINRKIDEGRVISDALDLVLMEQGLQFLVECFDETGIWWPTIETCRVVAEDFSRLTRGQYNWVEKEFLHTTYTEEAEVTYSTKTLLLDITRSFSSCANYALDALEGVA